MPDLPLNPIPDNCRVIDVCASIKCMDDEGNIMVFHRFTEGMNDHEALGRCITMADILRNQMMCGYEASDMEEDEDEES